jgi:hypothetical protein
MARLKAYTSKCIPPPNIYTLPSPLMVAERNPRSGSAAALGLGGCPAKRDTPVRRGEVRQAPQGDLRDKR